MKEIKIIAAGIVAITLMGGCGGNKGTGNHTESDSALTTEMESPVAGSTDYFLTRDSIGPVHVGMDVSSLPVAVPNLYDMMITSNTPDAMAYTYLLGDVPQFTIYDFMNGKADVILLEGNARGVETPDGELRVGDEFSKVLTLPGVAAEWINFDEEGIWYWKWNGLYFGVDETDMSERFGELLCSGNHPPRSADFTSSIKIGYIGTGLPY